MGELYPVFSIEIVIIVHYYLLTYAVGQIPSWEANRFSVSQEILCISGNPKVHYRVHKCLPPVPILRQLDPVHSPTLYWLKIHLNIILRSMLGSPKWSLSLRFPHQNRLYASPLPRTRYMSRPSHYSRFCHPKNIEWGVQIVQLLIMPLPPLSITLLLLLLLLLLLVVVVVVVVLLLWRDAGIGLVKDTVRWLYTNK
jgi:hypothetical protein